jgi:phosphoribosylformylglycinamidine cyclo-ligase
MPGFYSPGDYELVGFVVGMVDRPNLFDGSRVRPGDILLGIPTSGLHPNGYSLVRHIVFDRLRLGLADPMPGVNGSKTIGQLLLEPHRSYLSALTPLLRHPALHAMAHITGGGLTDNVPRVLPRNTQALIRIGSWKIPELFLALQKFGEVEIEEMLRVFNMGIGMVLVVAPDGLSDIIAELAKGGHSALPIGTVQGGDDGVAYDFEGTGAEAGVVGGT